MLVVQACTQSHNVRGRHVPGLHNAPVLGGPVMRALCRGTETSPTSHHLVMVEVTTGKGGTEGKSSVRRQFRFAETDCHVGQSHMRMPATPAHALPVARLPAVNLV